MDSFTLLHYALDQGYHVDCITFDYGQRHIKEIECARLICKENNLTNLQIEIANVESIFAKSALTSNEIEMPHGSYQAESMQTTIVPNRNMLFISHAIAYAISQNIDRVWYGAHAGDHFIYPDCRPEFYKNLIKSLKIGNWGGDKIEGYMPYINYTKADILKETLPFIKKLELDFKTIYRNTNTSYSPDSDGNSPGNTGSDIERILAFKEVGFEDPVKYREGWEKALKNAIKVEEDYQKSLK